MTHWFDREVEILEHELEQGYISQDEFKRAMRDLRHELRDAQSEAAEKAYNDYY